MKKTQGDGQDIESLLLELESDLSAVGGNKFRQERLPKDVDAWQLAERWDVDVSSARRTAKLLVTTGKWEWLRVRDPRCPQGVMVLRRIKNGQKASLPRGDKSKRK